MAFPLLALMLLAAEPARAREPVPTAASEPLPAGAPADDFSFVAWCDGVLAGHMDLAERVRSVMPTDPEQQKIGQAYLDAYEKALARSKEGATEAGRKRATEARAIGWNNWDKARAADLKLAAYTYLNWQLPGRCEHAAIRLSGDKSLFRMAPTLEEAQARGEATPVASSKAQQEANAARALDPSAPPPAAADSETPADAVRISTIPDAPKLPGDTAATTADGTAVASPDAAAAAASDDQKPADSAKPAKKKGMFGWLPW